MANMSLEELVRLIDPTLAVIRQLEPSSLKVCAVEKEGNVYVLKVSVPNGLSQFGPYHLGRERDILRYAHNIPGITHMVHDYGDVNGYSAILKEYFEGKNAIELRMAGGLFMPNVRRILKDTLGGLHSLGFAMIELKPANVIISPDGKDARIIDLGGYISKDEEREGTLFTFKQGIKRDNSALQDILSYVNAKRGKVKADVGLQERFAK